MGSLPNSNCKMRFLYLCLLVCLVGMASAMPEPARGSGRVGDRQRERESAAFPQTRQGEVAVVEVVEESQDGGEEEEEVAVVLETEEEDGGEVDIVVEEVEVVKNKPKKNKDNKDGIKKNNKNKKNDVREDPNKKNNKNKVRRVPLRKGPAKDRKK